jgi:membrane protein DedA with SNARE-associated domain
MTDALTHQLQELMTSPWIYLALIALAWLDGFLPAFPSESAVITAGVFAASGQPAWWLVVPAAALGAFAGDHTSYAIGRRFRKRVGRRAEEATRWGAALRRSRATLDARGGLVIVVARYVPGGRTAVTVAAGAVGYPLRRFSPFAALAAVSWALYGTAVGFVGGAAFEEDPFKGVVLGIGLALAMTALVEVGRHMFRRSRTVRAEAVVPAPRWDDDRVPVTESG